MSPAHRDDQTTLRTQVVQQSHSQIKRLQNFLIRNPVSSWVWRSDELIVWRMDREDFAPAPLTVTVAHNSWDHMERFQQTERWFPKDQFLRAADQRIKNGGHIFSALYGDILGSFIWATRQRDMIHFGEVDQDVSLLPYSNSLYHGYTNPTARRRGLYVACYTEALKHAFNTMGLEHVYTAVNPTNEAAVRTCERLGFARISLLYRYVRAGRVTKGHKDLTT